MTGRPDRLKIAAAILAGGDSKRLGGVAKGNIEVGNGISIIEKLIRELVRSGIVDIVIIANNPKLYQSCDVKIISDIRVGIGPMGGIEAGLVHFDGQSDAVMFVPCDMPNFTTREISALKKAFTEAATQVVFAETDGFFWHPLCAVVHNDLRKRISSAIDNGQRKIRDVWQQLKATKVRFADGNAFFNINNSTDIDRWRKAEDEKANLC